MKRDALILVAPYSPDQCAVRLERVVDRSIWAMAFHFGRNKPLRGRVNSSELKVARLLHYGNSFQIYFRATMQPNLEGGTTIVGSFAIHPLVKLFSTGWFICVAIIGADAFYKATL